MTESTDAAPASPAADDFELTPEILEAENRRNDYVLAGAALLLAFFVSFTREDVADLYLWLKTGSLVAEKLPHVPREDTLTYTVAGAPWVEPAWLHHWTLFQVRERFGEKALTLLKVALVAPIAALLLLLRHRGPTLWGASAVAMMALVAISPRLTASSEVAGLTILAVFLYVAHLAKYGGRPALIYLAIPLAALWANLDLSFFFIPALLIAWGVGEGFQELLPDSARFGGARRGQEVSLLIAGFAALAAGAATPYGLAGLKLRYDWFARILPEAPGVDRAAGGWGRIELDALVTGLGQGLLPWDRVFWVVLAVAAIVGVVVNFRFLNISRAFGVILAITAAIMVDRYSAPSALILAYAVGLSFEEFFLARFGAETKLAKGWLLWSQGGRAVTIVAAFLILVAAFTGRLSGSVGKFGWGVDATRYMTAAAEWLLKLAPQGNGFGFSNRVAAYRAWATPEQKNFADSRWQVVEPVLPRYSEARKSLAAGSTSAWKEIFDKDGVSHVIVNPSETTMRRPMVQMLRSPDLWPLFVSDEAVILGRSDKTVDQELFRKSRIRANELAFKTTREPPKPADRFVQPPGWIDMVWRNRRRIPPEMIAGSVYSSGTPAFDYPGASYLAVTLLRNAVASNVDNAEAHLQLAYAYRQIYTIEAEMFVASHPEAFGGGQLAPTSEPEAPRPPLRPKDEIPSPATKPAQPADPTPTKSAAAKERNFVAIEKLDPEAPAAPPSTKSPPPRFLLPLRHFQIMTELVNASLAGPLDYRVNISLMEFCRESEFLDAALENLRAALRYEFPPAEEKRERVYREQLLPTLEAEVERRRARFDEEVARMQSAGLQGELVLERAQLALRLNLPLYAMELLDEVSPFGPEMQRTAPMAVAVYLMMGRSEKADNLLREIRDQHLLPTGEWDALAAQVRVTSGQYKEARELIEHAIAEVRASRVGNALMSLETRFRGNAAMEAGNLLSIPFEATTQIADLEREAQYLATLGLLQLEMGEPKQTYATFKRALTLFPRHALRPIMTLYGELISSEPLPPEPPPYDQAQEIAIAFETKTDAKPASGTPRDEKPATTKNAKKDSKPAPTKDAKEAPKETKPAPTKTDAPPPTKPAAAPKAETPPAKAEKSAKPKS